MGKYLKLEQSKALEAYKNAPQNLKDALIKMYGKSAFITDIKERLEGYESACEILGRKPKTLAMFEELFDTKDQARRQFARHKIATGCEAISEGWVADFENESQWKYYNWMYNKKNGLSLCSDFCYSFCGVGSDLCLETAEKRDRIAEIFKEEYATYIFGY